MPIGLPSSAAIGAWTTAPTSRKRTTLAAVAWLKAGSAAPEGGAVHVVGQMEDAPIRAQAQRVLEVAASS